MNSLNIIGRIGADIQLRYLNSGQAVASFPIAVDQSYKKDGQKQSKVIIKLHKFDFIDKKENQGGKQEQQKVRQQHQQVEQFPDMDIYESEIPF